MVNDETFRELGTELIRLGTILRMNPGQTEGINPSAALPSLITSCTTKFDNTSLVTVETTIVAHALK